jgi:hypothetical protein
MLIRNMKKEERNIDHDLFCLLMGFVKIFFQFCGGFLFEKCFVSLFSIYFSFVYFRLRDLQIHY